MVARVTWQVRVSAGGVRDLGYHVVWCPKYRRPVLGGPVAARCEELIRARASEHGWPIAALEIMSDHVHLFVKAHPSHSPSHVARQFKGLTSRRLRDRVPAPAVAARRGSGNRKRIRRQLAREWRKVRNRRRDFPHKTARALVNTCDTIALECHRCRRRCVRPRQETVVCPVHGGMDADVNGARNVAARAGLGSGQAAPAARRSRCLRASERSRQAP
jgi:REP element-mobilizing transposase RayT